MKLFGNKRNAAHLAKGRLTGLQRGLILLAVCLLVLSGSVFALYQSFVKPVEIKQPTAAPVVDDTAATEQTVQFVPPTVIKVETKVDENTGEEITVEVEVPAAHKDGFYNILLLGTDEDGFRTDTIMIGRMDVKNHTVALLSIPRDTLIDCDYTVPKINSVYGMAGRGERGIASLKSRLAQLLGFEVDGYAMVNLEAFVELVDLIGGVEFDVPMDMDYEDSSQDLYIHLKKGKQTLDGEQAMGLVRFRKGYASQDIQRTKTQQAFLKALAKQCVSVVNLGKIGEMAQIFVENVTTDLTIGNLAYFAQELLKCDFDNMFTYTLEGEAVMVKDASCYAIYLNRTLNVVNEYFNPYDVKITSDNVSIITPEQAKAQQKAEEEEKEETSEPTEPLPEEPLPEEELPEEQFPWEDEEFWEDDSFWEDEDFWGDEDFGTEEEPPVEEDPWTEELPPEPPVELPPEEELPEPAPEEIPPESQEDPLTPVN